MFDLFEHLSTTLRRTFAAEEPVLPAVAAVPAPSSAAALRVEPAAEEPRPARAMAGAPAEGGVAPDPAGAPDRAAAAIPPDPAGWGPDGGRVVAGMVPEPLAIPLDPDTLEDAGGGEPPAPEGTLPVPRSQSPRHMGQLELGHGIGVRPRPAGTRPVRTVVVIPAYNEEQTLAEVIRAAKAVPEVSEVIVVSDGSTDATAAVAREHGAICIELRQNVGKGGAMKVGIDRADADVFVFLDADLIGVTPVHIQAMIHPVLRGDAAVAIAQLEGGRVATDLASVVAPNLSGQRAVTRAILQGMSGMETTRFGVEIAMKRYIKRNHIPVVRVPLDISHRTKEEKLGLLRGFLARMKEYWEIVKVAGE
jgi:hypothetical protein